jgi:hypothetical protein
LGDFNVRDDFRVLGIFDIEDRRAMRRVHVADERIALLNDNLPAAGHIRPSDLSHFFSDTKLRSVPVPFAHDSSPLELNRPFYQSQSQVVNQGLTHSHMQMM